MVISSPHARAAAAAAQGVRGPARDPAPAIGYAGAADLGIKLAAVLDVAEPDETVLLIHAADGCDAVVLHTTAALEAGRAPSRSPSSSRRPVTSATRRSSPGAG